MRKIAVPLLLAAVLLTAATTVVNNSIASAQIEPMQYNCFFPIALNARSQEDPTATVTSTAEPTTTVTATVVSPTATSVVTPTTGPTAPPGACWIVAEDAWQTMGCWEVEFPGHIVQLDVWNSGLPLPFSENVTLTDHPVRVIGGGRYRVWAQTCSLDQIQQQVSEHIARRGPQIAPKTIGAVSFTQALALGSIREWDQGCPPEAPTAPPTAATPPSPTATATPVQPTAVTPSPTATATPVQPTAVTTTATPTAPPGACWIVAEDAWQDMGCWEVNFPGYIVQLDVWNTGLPLPFSENVTLTDHPVRVIGGGRYRVWAQTCSLDQIQQQVSEHIARRGPQIAPKTIGAVSFTQALALGSIREWDMGCP